MLRKLGTLAILDAWQVPARGSGEASLLGMKRCSACGETKELSEFYARSEAPDGLRKDCKSCVRGRSARRRTEKPDEVRTAIRAWELKNPVRVRESKQKWSRDNPDAWRAWAASHPEQRRESSQRWYAGNRQKALTRSRQWAAENRERSKANLIRWREENQQASREISRRRRARLRENDIRAVTDRDWIRLVSRHDGLCAYCRERPWEHCDHVIPIARGGRHAIGNLLPACGRCNSSKKDRLLAEWRMHCAA